MLWVYDKYPVTKTQTHSHIRLYGHVMFCYLLLWLPHTVAPFTTYSPCCRVIAPCELSSAQRAILCFLFQVLVLLFSLRSSSSSPLISRLLCPSIFPSITWPKHYISNYLLCTVFSWFLWVLDQCWDCSRQFQVATTCFSCSPPYLNFNLLKPTSYVMYQQFNIQQLYALHTVYICVLCGSENKQRLVPLTA